LSQCRTVHLILIFKYEKRSVSIKAFDKSLQGSNYYILDSGSCIRDSSFESNCHPDLLKEGMPLAAKVGYPEVGFAHESEAEFANFLDFYNDFLDVRN